MLSENDFITRRAKDRILRSCNARLHDKLEMCPCRGSKEDKCTHRATPFWLPNLYNRVYEIVSNEDGELEFKKVEPALVPKKNEMFFEKFGDEYFPLDLRIGHPYIFEPEDATLKLLLRDLIEECYEKQIDTMSKYLETFGIKDLEFFIGFENLLSDVKEAFRILEKITRHPAVQKVISCYPELRGDYERYQELKPKTKIFFTSLGHIFGKRYKQWLKAVLKTYDLRHRGIGFKIEVFWDKIKFNVKEKVMNFHSGFLAHSPKIEEIEKELDSFQIKSFKNFVQAPKRFWDLKRRKEQLEREDKIHMKAVEIVDELM